MDRFEQDRDTLNEWVQLKDVDKSLIIAENIAKDSHIGLKEIKQYKIKQNNILNTMRKRFDKHFREMVNYGTLPKSKTPINFMGLSGIFKKRK